MPEDQIFARKKLAWQNLVFAGGFGLLWCFLMVKSWWVCGGMRGERGDLQRTFWGL